MAYNFVLRKGFKEPANEPKPHTGRHPRPRQTSEHEPIANPKAIDIMVFDYSK
jgi:hypothetical protein